MMSPIRLLGLSLLIPVTLAWSDSPVSSTSASYTNSSTATSALQATTLSAAPTYCGGCALIYQVHASVWWPSVVTEVVATMVYVVDNSTGSTIGSSLKYPSNTTTIGGATNYSQIASASFVEYTTFTAMSDIESATIVQENIITFNASHYENGYVVSTLGVNTTATGSLVGVTQCLGSYYTPNPLSTNVPPYLPASTAYIYTTVVAFNSTYNMSNVLSLGLNIFASSVATHLHLTVPNCTSGGGGYGTLKIPVLPSTVSETQYAAPQAQVVTTTASMVSAPPAKITTTQAVLPPPPGSSLPAVTTTTELAPPPPVTSVSVPTSIDQPVPPPPPPPSSSLPLSNSIYVPPSSSTEPEASVESIANPTSSSAPTTTAEPSYTTTILQTTSGPAGLSTLTSIATLPIPPYISSSYITTIVETISGPSGLETISTIATLPGPSSYTTTILETTSGPSGLETISEVTTLPIGSYIISFLGITGSGSAATTTSGSVPSSTSTGSGPVQVTGGAHREGLDKSAWAVIAGLAGFALEVL